MPSEHHELYPCKFCNEIPTKRTSASLICKCGNRIYAVTTEIGEFVPMDKLVKIWNSTNVNPAKLIQKSHDNLQAALSKFYAATQYAKDFSEILNLEESTELQKQILHHIKICGCEKYPQIDYFKDC